MTFSSQLETLMSEQNSILSTPPSGRIISGAPPLLLLQYLHIVLITLQLLTNTFSLHTALSIFTKMSFAFLLNITGAFLLLHSAFSCLHYRTLLEDLEATIIPPLDVVAECLGGFFILLLSQLWSAGALVPMSENSKRALVAPSYQSRDFDIYVNRAHVMKDQVVVVRNE